MTSTAAAVDTVTTSAQRLVELINKDDSLVAALTPAGKKLNRVKGLTMFPEHVLTFNVSPTNNQQQQQPVACAISIQNHLSHRVYFRLKTNKHMRYTVVPKEGILRARSVATIWVTVAPQFVCELLDSGFTGVLRRDDVVLMTLVKLTERFGDLYDAVDGGAGKDATKSSCPC